MQDGRAHQILAQIPLTVSPYISLPVATTLPYTYKSVPSTLPPSSAGEESDNSKPQYVVSQSGHAAHPDEIIASCQALQAHLEKLQDDAEVTLRRWQEDIRQRELAEKRRVAPGWLDRDEKILEPQRAPAGLRLQSDHTGTVVSSDKMQAPIPPDTSRSDEGEAMDRAFGDMRTARGRRLRANERDPWWDIRSPLPYKISKIESSHVSDALDFKLLDLAFTVSYHFPLTMEVLHEAPVTSHFRPLVEFEAQTPSSFYSGPPVLHYRASNTRLLALAAELLPTAFSKLADLPSQHQPTQNGDHHPHGDGAMIVPGIDVWATSERLILFRVARSVGISVPYPNISVHAVQRLEDPDTQDETQGIYLQVVTSDGFDDHDPEGTLSLTLLPFLGELASNNHTQDEQDSTSSAAERSNPVSALFDAISACSSLHPDVASSSSSVDIDRNQEIEGLGSETWEVTPVDGLPPPMPGSSGWITAENMDQFFDEDGNWRGRGLGPGAGVVRQREDEAVDQNGTGASEGSSEETKWRRTD